MASRKAETVSLSGLARAVDRAVAIAARRHDLVVERSTLLDRWEIFGRRLDRVRDLNEVFAFARDVAGSVKLAGIRPEPVVCRFGRHILVGFIERAGIPRLLK